MFERVRGAVDELRRMATPSRVPVAPSDPDDLAVELTMPTWTVHRSTDRGYIYDRFTRLAQSHPLQFQAADRLGYLGAWNGRYVVRRVAARLGAHVTQGVWTPVFRSQGRPDVVFSYGEYPKHFDAAPVVWEHTFSPQLDADEAAFVAHWHARASGVVERATRVVTATDSSAEWFARMFPRHAAKVRAIPYFFPELAPIDPYRFDAKLSDDAQLRVIFVGKEARRKGLETLLAGWQLLAADLRARVDVHVVSSMLDGDVKLPPTWRWDRFVPNVQAAIERAHVLALPARAEAYGLVLVEGMAAGCAPLTTRAPIQRSIVGAEAGVFVDPREPREIAAALKQLLEDRGYRGDRMRAARAHFVMRYHPHVVSQNYADLLWSAAGRAGSCPRRSCEAG